MEILVWRAGQVAGMSFLTAARKSKQGRVFEGDRRLSCIFHQYSQPIPEPRPSRLIPPQPLCRELPVERAHWIQEFFYGPSHCTKSITLEKLRSVLYCSRNFPKPNPVNELSALPPKNTPHPHPLKTPHLVSERSSTYAKSTCYNSGQVTT